ncbi:MFS transporter [Halodesulfovibrio marinisediminis]|uniref:Predicted arabinose efflux permease, MFS family n=1 Tax=Halodesulfovibrio marinisediminis DSM 17456 TaxID=1121457 RepID=A0A1N6DT72_9BACT|nr:MFS transporter [Halodesulfovibrio marinisediminis]SIN73903.1 Predicted arabinose efflux permease, MFS family [Halodesulfovibrio marinisediminis DSM 17456]
MKNLFKDKNLLLLFGITLFVVMGVSSILPVLPSAGRSLNIPDSQIGLLLTSFTLPGIFLTPFAGILADRYGRKAVLIPSLILFGIAGFSCSLTTDYQLILFLRVLQGIGVAPISLLYTTITGDLYSGQRRLEVMGYNATVLSLGTALFPFIGGLLGELGWQYPFMLPLLALPLAVLCAIYLDIPNPKSKETITSYFKKTAQIVSSKRALVLFGMTLCTFTILYGPIITYVPILSDTVFNASPSRIGLLFAISSVFTGAAASQLGRLRRIIPVRTMLCFAAVFFSAAMVTMPIPSNFWLLAIPVGFFGMGQGLSFPNLAAKLTGIASIEKRGAVMAVNGTVLRLAQTISPPLFSLPLLFGGISSVFYSATLVGAVMFFLALNCPSDAHTQN